MMSSVRVIVVQAVKFWVYFVGGWSQDDSKVFWLKQLEDELFGLGVYAPFSGCSSFP